jgi:hypothetical protein
MNKQLRHHNDDETTRIHKQSRDLFASLGYNLEPPRTTVAEVIGQIAMGAIFGLVFAWVLINWISGCGEIIYTATGAIPGECIFMPWVD